MADLPLHTTKTVTRHEWEIGSGEEFDIARALEDGLYFAKQQMVDLGIQVETDDCYRWRAGDGATIIVYVDVED